MAMNDAPHLLVGEEDGILIATFNRPEKLNAMSLELVHALGDEVERFRDTPSLKVMLIRATGRYFSSGADLKQGAGGPPPKTGSGIRETHRRLPSRMRQIWDEIEHVEKPFASAGYAFPEAKFGVLPATNGVSRLTRVVGPHWARLLIMANQPATAQEGWNMGLVHKVFPDETFEADVMAFCRHLTQQNGEMMGVAKIAIELAADLGVDQAAAVERMANSTLMLAPAYQEMMKAHIDSLGKKKG
jgi:enoyl-CoA hydratase